MLTPELEQKIPFVLKCRAVDDEVLNVADDVLARTKKANPFFVGLRPVSAVPVRSIASTKESC